MRWVMMWLNQPDGDTHVGELLRRDYVKIVRKATASEVGAARFSADACRRIMPRMSGCPAWIQEPLGRLLSTALPT
jgi:hypothetical protein